jgi:hypothetical protein
MAVVVRHISVETCMTVRVELALDVVVRAFTIVAVSVWLLPVVACGKSPYSLKFVDLTLADQIEVTTDKITIVTDKKQIDAAAQFFNRHRDGWTSVMDGGGAPLFLRFKRNGVDIGTFGVGQRYLSVGVSTLRPPEAEIAALVRGFGIPWPPYQEIRQPH